MSNPNPCNQFENGKSGNPNGRPRKGESITELMRTLLEDEHETKEGKKKLKEIFCKKVLELALKGDITAVRMIWNYLDGMPVQTNINENTNKEISIVVSKDESDI